MNNPGPYTNEQLSSEELFAPVVDKGSEPISLCESAWTHSYILEDEKNTVQLLFKSVNGIGNAAQVWNKHYDNGRFMIQEGFIRSRMMSSFLSILSQVLTVHSMWMMSADANK